MFEAGSPYLATPSSSSKTLFDKLTNVALGLATFISVMKWIVIPLFL